jgi:hypothetical protein
MRIQTVKFQRTQVGTLGIVAFQSTYILCESVGHETRLTI